MFKFVVLTLILAVVARAQDPPRVYEKEPCSEPFYHIDNKCGFPEHGYMRCPPGNWCSKYGYCGNTTDYSIHYICPKETRLDTNPKVFKPAPNDGPDELRRFYEWEQCKSTDCGASEEDSYVPIDEYEEASYVPVDEYKEASYDENKDDEKKRNWWQKFWENCLGWLHHKKEPKYEVEYYPFPHSYKPEEDQYKSKQDSYDDQYQPESQSYQPEPESEIDSYEPLQNMYKSDKFRSRMNLYHA